MATEVPDTLPTQPKVSISNQRMSKFSKLGERYVIAYKNFHKKHRILFWLTLISAVFVLISTVLYTLSTKGNWGIAYETPLAVGVNLLTSVLAAFLIESLARYREALQIDEKQRKLWGLLGYVDSPPANIYVVLPQFLENNEAVNQKQLDLWKVKIDDINDPRIKNKIEFALQPDIRVAAKIIALFSKLGLDLPEIIWDNAIFDSTGNPKIANQNALYICVGLFSNKVTHWLSKSSHHNKLFSLKAEPASIGKRPFTLEVADYHQGGIDPHKHGWKLYSFERDSEDYGLISRINILPWRVTLFIIGGIDAYGTERSGEYFNESWEELLAWPDNDTRQRVEKSEQFAAVLKIPYSQIGIKKEHRITD